LTTVKRDQDEIVILVDSAHMNSEVIKVIDKYEVVKGFRDFNRDFAAHKNYLRTLCTKEFIFNIDADEVPTEKLIRTVERTIEETEHDLLYVPRINIVLGSTEEFIKKHKFNQNQLGWINWPDYQGRVYKRQLRWAGKVHERIEGSKSTAAMGENPEIALWHVKTAEKQDRQNALYDTL
jgi:hypothetical protein